MTDYEMTEDVADVLQPVYADQLQCASSSVLLNIAEGAGEYSSSILS